MTKIDLKIPKGQLAEKWSNHKAHQKLANPTNKRRLGIIVIGIGLTGASATVSLGEMGFRVFNSCIQDSPRCTHSTATQGGINTAKNYQNDGDSVHCLFHDTIKGGDYRACEINVYRLAEVSSAIIDQCIAQGVPLAHDYNGTFDNCLFGGAQVSRMFYARDQAGQQLLLGAYSALSRQVQKGTVKLYTRHEMLDLVVIEGRIHGIITRSLVTGEIERFVAHAVVTDTGGYGSAFFLSINAMGSNSSVVIQYYERGACFANPCSVQIHPTCVPVHDDKQSELILMSEPLRNDSRIWVPKKIEGIKALQVGTRKPAEIPDEDHDSYLKRRYPAFSNLVPCDVASCVAKEHCDASFGANNTGLVVFPDFKYAIDRLGEDVACIRYDNLFDMYKGITDENPYKTPTMIFLAIHHTMGDIWADYKLMTPIPGLFTIDEADFPDHGANRLGAPVSAQGLADGHLVLFYTIQNYLADQIRTPHFSTDLPEFAAAEKEVKDKIQKIKAVNGKHPVGSIHKKLDYIMQDFIGMTCVKEFLQEALTGIQEVKKDFLANVRIPGEVSKLNVEFEKTPRLIDFAKVGMLMVRDGLNREESCGKHFRTECRTPEDEALRDDKNFFYVTCWKYTSEDPEPELIEEDSNYQFVKVQARNYKSQFG